jgi:hypothetical protein
MEKELGDLLQQVHRIMAPAEKAGGSRISDLSGSPRWLSGSFRALFVYWAWRCIVRWLG